MAGKIHIDQTLLARYFNDQCTEQEKQAVLDWLSDPENKLVARTAMERQWRARRQPEDAAEPDIEKLLAQTREKLFHNDDLSRRQPRSFTWRMAAMWAGMLMAATGLIFALMQIKVQPRLSAGDNQVIKSTSGQVILKTLSDGTKIWLNAQSSITAPATFSGLSAREVTLEGEAFFDVAEDKEHPFIVRTKAVTIRVLGTAFNIKSYTGDPTIETTLVRGKVVIENSKAPAGKSIALKPNQKAVFSHATESITLVQVEAKDHTSWSSESLVFEEDRLYDVIRSLERWYGIVIHLEEGSTMDCRLTARIDKESLTETLQVLRSLTGVEYTVAGNEVFIKGRICEQ